MFYEHTVLTNRKDGLSIVWLAATLGAKHSLKKLQKRDYLSVDIRKTCNYISAPAEPLALRTSSSLMVGVSRVFARQCGFLYADVFTAHTKIKQNLLSLQATIGPDLDLPNASRSRPDALLLPDDPNFDLEMLMVPNFETLGAGIDLSNLSITRHDGHSSLSAEQSLLPGSQLASLSFTMDSQAVINRPSLGELGLENLLEVEDDEGLGFAFDADGEIIERPEMAESGIERLGASTGKRPRAEEDTRTVLAYLEPGFSGSPVKRARSSQSFYSNFENLPQVGLFNGLEDLSPIRAPNQTSESSHRLVDLDFVEEQPLMAQAASQARKRKARVLTLDSAIEVTSSTLKDWQNSYLTSMKKHKLVRMSKQEREITNENAKLYTWAYEGRIQHPLLQEVFCRRLPGTNIYKRDLRTYKTSPMADLDTPRFESEIAVGEDIMNSEIELGRRAGSEERDFLSGQNSLLPWNMSREGSQIRSVSGAGVSTNSLLNTPRQFSFMQTPVLKSRQASLRPGSRASGAIGMGGLERVDSQEVAEDTEHGGPVAGNLGIDTQVANDSQYILQSMQQESLNFLEYTRTKLAESSQARKRDSVISFSDVVPPNETTAFVAAQAFSHVLLLATRSALSVRQEAAYEEITLSDLLART